MPLRKAIAALIQMARPKHHIRWFRENGVLVIKLPRTGAQHSKQEPETETELRTLIDWLEGEGFTFRR